MRYLKFAAAVVLAVILGLSINAHAHRRSWGAAGIASRAMSLQDAPRSEAHQAGVAQAAKRTAGGSEEAGESGPAWSRPDSSAVQGPKLIRSGTLSIELKSYAEGQRAAEAIARSFDGFVADAKSSSEGGHAGGSLTIRVPAARFDEAFRELSRLGEVKSVQVHAEDVTKQYFDLETRLRVERDAEARLREVLRNRTAKLSDIVEAERELTRIVAEIEQTEGERIFYDRQIAYSTITLDLSEPAAAIAAAHEPPLLEPIRNALHDSARLLVASVAGLIYAGAVGLPWAGVLLLAWVLIRRVRSRRALRAI